MIAQNANKLNVDRISIDAKSFKLNNSKYSQAFTEGIILGNYQFLEYLKVNSN